MLCVEDELQTQQTFFTILFFLCTLLHLTLLLVFLFPSAVLIGPSSVIGALQRYRLAGTCLDEHDKQHMSLK